MEIKRQDSLKITVMMIVIVAIIIIIIIFFTYLFFYLGAENSLPLSNTPYGLSALPNKPRFSLSHVAGDSRFLFAEVYSLFVVAVVAASHKMIDRVEQFKF